MTEKMILTKNNFKEYVLEHYENTQIWQDDEWKEDIEKIKYIKRILNKYQKTGYVKIQLLLNHVIILLNVFGINPAANILFYKMDEEYYSQIKTMLLFLHALPKTKTIQNINIDDIPEDKVLKTKLENL